MNVVVFGSGPLPCEPDYPVTAPGSRTWQIAHAAAAGLAAAGHVNAQVTIVGLEENSRPTGQASVSFTLSTPAGDIPGTYQPLTCEAFQKAATGADNQAVLLPAEVHCVIGCGSVQAYSSAAAFAARSSSPLWIDVFGDPISEIQTQANLSPEKDSVKGQQLVHVWKLLLDGLLYGDRFSALSSRQRYALIGQLGAAGRLNQFTADIDLVETIPYGILPLREVVPTTSTESPVSPTFTVMWSGGFNTWMDLDALINGLTHALKQNPRLRLLVVGGDIQGYSNQAYGKFVSGIKSAGVEGSVTLMDWQPLSGMQRLYSQCDVGINIDRYSNEAVLGSRTRIVNFLASGKPVLTTVITELSEELASKGLVIPFKLGDAADLTRVLLECSRIPAKMAETGALGKQHVYTQYNAFTCSRVLSQWVQNPQVGGDKVPAGTAKDSLFGNPLMQYWQRVRKSIQ